MKIVLAGSPSISVPAFKKVIENFDVVAVITQPDRPQGRGMTIQETPVAQLAKEYKIKTFKPNKIGELRAELEKLNYDLFLTFAFGQYIPSFILSQGNFKPLNIHGSLLPKYRGAAPIHAAILNGDDELGITLMEMVKKMDAGAMYAKAAMKITEFTTTGEAFAIVEKLAKDNIVPWLNDYFDHKLTPKKQSDSYSTQGKITKEFAELKPTLSKEVAMRKIRGLNPFPGAYLYQDGKRLKIFNVQAETCPDCIQLDFIDGQLQANDYQWEGKKRKKPSNNGT